MVFVALLSSTVIISCHLLEEAFLNACPDPNDPLRHLYDVDNEDTVITLAEWYHLLAPAATNQFFSTGLVP